MKKAFLLGTITLILIQVFGQTSYLENCDSLKILSWNIYMLPVSIKKVGQPKRVEHIAEQMNNSDYDIIVFQEAFDRNVRYKLGKLMREKYPYQEGPANAKPSWFRMNSGVWILSKHPMKYLDELDFKESAGLDNLARKGALLVEINKNGKLYQIAGTHLQSGESNKKDKIRISQINEIEKLIQKHEHDGIPQLICGDFNIPKNDNLHYNLMIEKLKVKDGNIESTLQYTYDCLGNDLAIGKNKYHEILDYILLKENNSSVRLYNRKIISFTANWDSIKKSLSDHYAIEMLIIPE